MRTHITSLITLVKKSPRNAAYILALLAFYSASLPLITAVYFMQLLRYIYILLIKKPKILPFVTYYNHKHPVKSLLVYTLWLEPGDRAYSAALRLKYRGMGDRPSIRLMVGVVASRALLAAITGLPAVYLKLILDAAVSIDLVEPHTRDDWRLCAETFIGIRVSQLS